MKLSNIANKFNTTVATDSYGTSTFMCQLEPLSLFKVDGVAVKKRSLSTAPDVVIPPRGVIKIEDDNYLVGTGTPDLWMGSVIRRNYVIQGADGIASLTSIANKLAGTAPAQAYAALLFSRYLPESADSSKYPPQYQIFLAGTESAPADSLVTLDGKWYLVKESYVSTSGLRIVMANMLAEPIFETASFGAKTYDPITDSYSGASTATPIMRVKWQEHFSYLSIGSTTYQRGDVQVLMGKAVTPKTSDVLTLSDGVWRILAVLDDGAQWSLHVRRV